MRYHVEVKMEYLVSKKLVQVHQVNRQPLLVNLQLDSLIEKTLLRVESGFTSGSRLLPCFVLLSGAQLS